MYSIVRPGIQDPKPDPDISLQIILILQRSCIHG